MVGAKVDPYALYQDFARGKASVAVDFAEMTVDVSFTEIGTFVSANGLTT